VELEALDKKIAQPCMTSFERHQLLPTINLKSTVAFGSLLVIFSPPPGSLLSTKMPKPVNLYSFEDTDALARSLRAYVIDAQNEYAASAYYCFRHERSLTSMIDPSRATRFSE
jgi:hypothetical protein